MMKNGETRLRMQTKNLLKLLRKIVWGKTNDLTNTQTQGVQQAQSVADRNFTGYCRVRMQMLLPAFFNLF